MRYFLILLIVGFISCREENKTNEEITNEFIEDIDTTSLKGTWYLKDNPGIDGFVKINYLSQNKICGTHEFIGQNGNRIDFCETNSFTLEKLDSLRWGGQLIDCYEGLTHEIILYLQNEFEMTMVFVNDSHPFLTNDSLLFSK